MRWEILLLLLQHHLARLRQFRWLQNGRRVLNHGRSARMPRDKKEKGPGTRAQTRQDEETRKRLRSSAGSETDSGGDSDDDGKTIRKN